jgi:hypothetical protein
MRSCKPCAAAMVMLQHVAKMVCGMLGNQLRAVHWCEHPGRGMRLAASYQHRCAAPRPVSSCYPAFVTVLTYVG